MKQNRLKKAAPILLTIILVWLFTACEKDFSVVKQEPGVTAPDTTSHNFTWTVDTFGIGGSGSSYLLDVAIINENDIWAVGKIYTDTDKFNALHWNGIEWELVKIPVKIFNTSTFVTGRLKAIVALNSHNILVTDGGEVITFNGLSWGNWTFLFTDLNDTTFGGINKFWAEQPDKVYGVGNKGNIFLGDGQTWQKLDSGTDVDIKDIWGAKNEITGKYEILAVASLQNYGREMDLLRIEGTQVSHLDTNGLHVNQSSIWFIPEKSYYITGNGVFTKQTLNDSLWQNQPGHPLLYKDAVRGNDWNDAFVVGASGLVSHNNGSSWRHYTEGELPSFYGAYNAVAIKDDMVVAVGDINAVYGIVLVGKR